MPSPKWRWESRLSCEPHPEADHRPSRRSLIWLLILLGFSSVLETVVALQASVTTDEPHHVAYGRRILQLNPDRLNPEFCDSQMPVSALNALPVVLAAQLETHGSLHRLSADTNLWLARIPTILASLGLVVLVFFWAYDLYGEGPAIASCLLCVLSPNLVAHGTLATTDMYHTVGVIGALYFLRRFLLQPTASRAAASGLALALAQITKSFALVLYPMAGLAIAVVMFSRSVPALTPKRALIFTVMAAVCFVAVLNVAFCFDRTFKPVGSYPENTSLSRLATTPVLRVVPIPVPYPFLQGLLMMRADEAVGRTFGNIYLLGQVRDTSNPLVRGFKSYYAVTYFYKEPIAVQILFVWGLVWVFRKRKLQGFVTGEGLLLVTAAILLIWLSCFNRAQIGIRHILPFLAVETIVAGAAFNNFSSKPRPQKIILCSLVLWLAISGARYYPQMIPYMNEWAGNPRLAYRILSDSNLDWGQDAAIVKQFLRENPDVTLDPPQPKAGRVLIRADRLTGVYREDSAGYLAERYEPVAQVGYGHFLFVIPAEDVKSGKLQP